jgi:hypothetical protein
MPKHTPAEKAKNKKIKVALKGAVDGKTGPAKTAKGTMTRRISDLQKEIDRMTKLKSTMMKKASKQ